MWLRTGLRTSLVVFLAFATTDCTHDYGQFVVDGTGAAAGNAGNAGGSGGEGGADAADDVSAETSGDASQDRESHDALSDVPMFVDALPDGGCSSGYKSCGELCAPVDSPVTGCAAASCEPCPASNGAPACLGGACAITCDPGFADCNDKISDGCEQPTSNEPSQCGACGRSCGSDNVASLQCSNGLCTPSCKPGHANCNDTPDAGPDDGCERDVSANASSCGSCANDCTKQGVGGFVCAGGVCGCTTDGQCHLGGNGSAVCDTASARCVCTGTVCAAGEACLRSGASQVCSCNGKAACAAGQTCCQTPAGCLDLQADPANCGACGRACPAGFACNAGACVCDADADCNGGAFGTCGSGVCTCGGTTCGPEQRCMSGGTCG